MSSTPVDPALRSAPAVFDLPSAPHGVVTIVLAVAGDDALARRLAAAGLWPGVQVERIGRAPLGDPLLFRLHGYRLALRRSEAARVQVAMVEAGR